ncbi:c-myc promoter binding protein [Anaeramoeba flamelloides]|uniref:C-myc promoter binding protein n=1 Tax=Anaeramoeba flamelloides TaxID=1746091 RepID=A0ABQ8YF70_9EUKA|nr:c-myc promoter binding protein [Anaeramoeba flamelloides]
MSKFFEFVILSGIGHDLLAIDIDNSNGITYAMEILFEPQIICIEPKTTTPPPLIEKFLQPEEGLRLHSSRKESFLHEFVLTDSNHQKLYGFTLTTFPQFSTNKYQSLFELFKKQGRETGLPSTLHSPRSIAIVTKYPFHQTFHRILNLFLDSCKTPKLTKTSVKQLVQILSRVTVSKNLQLPSIVSITENSSVVIPKIKLDSDLPLVDIDYRPLFSTLSPENIIIVFTALLHERQIVFISKILTNLTQCIIAMISLLYPLKWHHPLIPVLPADFIEIFQSPVPSLIGCYSSIIEMEFPTGDTVIVDIDSDHIVSETSLKALPIRIQLKLKKIIEKYCNLYEGPKKSLRISPLSGYKSIEMIPEESGYLSTSFSSSESDDDVFDYDDDDDDDDDDDEYYEETENFKLPIKWRNLNQKKMSENNNNGLKKKNNFDHNDQKTCENNYKKKKPNNKKPNQTKIIYSKSYDQNVLKNNLKKKNLDRIFSSKLQLQQKNFISESNDDIIPWIFPKTQFNNQFSKQNFFNNKNSKEKDEKHEEEQKEKKPNNNNNEKEQEKVDENAKNKKEKEKEKKRERERETNRKEKEKEKVDENEKEIKKEKKFLKIEKIRKGFLSIFVKWLKNYPRFVITPTEENPDPDDLFDSIGFLKHAPEDSILFLRKFLNSQMFISYIEEKILDLNKDDHYFEKFVENKMKLQSKIYFKYSSCFIQGYLLQKMGNKYHFWEKKFVSLEKDKLKCYLNNHGYLNNKNKQSKINNKSEKEKNPVQIYSLIKGKTKIYIPQKLSKNEIQNIGYPFKIKFPIYQRNRNRNRNRNWNTDVSVGVDVDVDKDMAVDVNKNANKDKNLIKKQHKEIHFAAATRKSRRKWIKILKASSISQEETDFLQSFNKIQTKESHKNFIKKKRMEKEEIVRTNETKFLTSKKKVVSIGVLPKKKINIEKNENNQQEDQDEINSKFQYPFLENEIIEKKK